MKWKNGYGRSLATLAIFAGIACCASGAIAQDRGYFPDPKLADRSKQYSNAAVRERPELGLLLESQGLDYLHQLDPGIVYSIDIRSGSVTLTKPSTEEDGLAIGPAGIFWGFGSPTVLIASGGATTLIGEAATTVTCPFSAQSAEVAGFMASTVSRDPIGGIRNGTLVVDTLLSSKSQVNFSILKVSGGARNPQNRTVLESTHIGSCGDEVRVQNLVTTWPPARIGLAIDDTGSMGTQLARVKTG